MSYAFVTYRSAAAAAAAFAHLNEETVSKTLATLHLPLSERVYGGGKRGVSLSFRLWGASLRPLSVRGAVDLFSLHGTCMEQMEGLQHGGAFCGVRHSS